MLYFLTNSTEIIIKATSIWNFISSSTYDISETRTTVTTYLHKLLAFAVYLNASTSHVLYDDHH